MTQTIKFFVSILLISTSAISIAAAAPRAVTFDYFGTGKSNYVLLGSTKDGRRLWAILRNPVTNSPQTRFIFWGLVSDEAIFGDWDGDLKTDIAVWRPGTTANPQSWYYIQRSSDPNPNAIFAVPWGAGTDSPVTGDFDGDGKDDFCVVRPEGEQLIWYILPSGGGNFRRIAFGSTSTDSPFSRVGDFNGDGRDDLIVGREAADGTLTFYVGDAQTGALILAQPWGNTNIANLRIFIGNYVGDSRADIAAVYGECLPANPNCGVAGTWWIKETGSSNHTATRFGIPFNYKTGEGDFAEVGDFDGDGKDDITVARQTGSLAFTFYHLLSSNGQIAAQEWDLSTALPLESGLGDLLAPHARLFPASLFQTMFVNRDAGGAFTAKRGADFFKIEK